MCKVLGRVSEAGGQARLRILSTGAIYDNYNKINTDDTMTDDTYKYYDMTLAPLHPSPTIDRRYLQQNRDFRRIYII